MREKLILKEFLKSTEYINLEKLGKQIGVSTRTLRSDLKILSNDGKKNGFSIQNKRGFGYYLKVDDEERLSQYKESMFDYEDLNPKKRVDFIIRELMKHESFLTMDFLADALGVSKSTIKTDLEKVAKILNTKGITLEKKAHYGIKISGDEFELRCFFVGLIKENFNLLEPYEGLKGTESTIMNIFKAYDLIINTEELDFIRLFIRVSLNRSAAKILLNSVEGIKEFEDISREIIGMLNTELVLKLGEEEVVILSRLLKNKTSIRKNDFNNVDDIKNEIRKFLYSIDEEYETSFSQDKFLEKSLIYHITSLIKRLNENVQFINPIIDEISCKYPEMFNISIRFARILENRYSIKIPNGEIGYLTMHLAAHTEQVMKKKISNIKKIAIVCSSGGGVAIFIKLKLKTVFENAVIKTFSLIDIVEIKTYSPDLIFSISDLAYDFKIPVIKIKELLEDADLINIKDCVMFNKFDNDNRDNSIRNLFSEELFFKIDSARTYEGQIRVMADKVCKVGIADENYCEYTLEREKIISTVYENGIAIPHPIEMCGYENKIAVSVLKNPILHKGKSVKLIFLVCLKKGELELHKIITKKLLNLMASTDTIERLSKVSNYNSFMININDFI